MAEQENLWSRPQIVGEPGIQVTSRNGHRTRIVKASEAQKWLDRGYWIDKTDLSTNEA